MEEEEGRVDTAAAGCSPPSIIIIIPKAGRGRGVLVSREVEEGEEVAAKWKGREGGGKAAAVAADDTTAGTAYC